MLDRDGTIGNKNRYVVSCIIVTHHFQLSITKGSAQLNGRMAMLGFIALLATEFALGGESFTRGLLGIG